MTKNLFSPPEHPDFEFEGLTLQRPSLLAQLFLYILQFFCLPLLPPFSPARKLPAGTIAATTSTPELPGVRPWIAADFSAASTEPKLCPFNTGNGSAEWHAAVVLPRACTPTSSSITRGIQFNCGWCSTKLCTNCNVHLLPSSQRIRSSLGTKTESLYCIGCWERLQTKHTPLGICPHCNRYVWRHYYGVDWSESPGQPTPRYFHPNCEDFYQNQRIDGPWRNVFKPHSPIPTSPVHTQDESIPSIRAPVTPPPSLPAAGSRRAHFQTK